MNNKECIEDLKNGDLYDEKGFVSEHGYAVLFHAEAHHEIFRDDWIPIKTRPLTEESRVRFKHFPNQFGEISIESVKLEKPDIDVTICEDCLSHYTLADIVARFERKKF